MPDVWTADAGGIARAAERLAAGGLVGVPTETVYGLAADAANARAVAGVFAAKGRPAFNPLIVHVSDAEQAARFGLFGEAARLLAEAFWPGPLTLVLPLAKGAPLADLATAGLGTVALRAPRHPVARALLGAHGAFVAPSANRSGRVSPTAAAHVIAEFGDKVPVLDGGPCEAGLESTIIGLAGEDPSLLRPGTIAPGEVEAVLCRALGAPGPGIAAPGMTSSHYAPASVVRLDAQSARDGEVLLGFAGMPGARADLSPSGDLEEAAANLFGMLRALDGQASVIAVARIPEEGLGIAINDRLRRAAAPRA